MNRVFPNAACVVMAVSLAGCSSAAGPTPGAVEPAPAPAQAVASSTTAALGSGVYTVEQAARGGEVFQRRCARCHEDLSRETFIVPWVRAPLSMMFTFISTTMPRGAPGALSRQQYADVIAHLLAINGIPAGATELPADTRALSQIRVQAPTH